MEQDIKGLLEKIKNANENHKNICGNFGREMTITMQDAFLIERLAKDANRLNKLQELSTGYGKGWILRDSIYGREMRLHETSGDLNLGKPNKDIRKAIDNFKL